MDVERTMEFILQQQAAFSANLGQMREEFHALHREMTERQKAMQHQQEAMQQQQMVMQRQIDGVLKLIRMGMKWLRRHDEQIAALIESQKRTDGKLDRLIEAIGRQHTNGQ